MPNAFQVTGKNPAAPFTLKVHRGEGMCLVAMNWRSGRPPADFVGFAIEYREPGGDRFFALKNRLTFAGSDGSVSSNALSSKLAPFQKFRWVHFPRNANIQGDFTYRVTPVFMNGASELSYGEAQEADIQLYRETYPDELNVAFTRGFVSSQAFVDRYVAKGSISKLLPPTADEGLTFQPTHPEATEALAWMGFEARERILNVLDRAIADKASVMAVVYDLNEPEVTRRLELVGYRLKIIIDDSGTHGGPQSGESQAAARLIAAGCDVRRQHMGGLQHNKTIIVDGPTEKLAVCGSTNLSWRGLYVQANNAVILTGAAPVATFRAAFDIYWSNQNDATAFGAAAPANWHDLGLANIDAKVTFSPHSKGNACLDAIAEDVAKTKSSLLFSLAFLYQTKGVMKDNFIAVRDDDSRFVYGISDRRTGGLDVQKPDGNLSVVYPGALTKGVPSPFMEEPMGGAGNRIHHKFIVIDFDKPSARVYMGSYNFSLAADRKNGENLLCIRDRRIATAYAIEALRLVDHYHFRIVQAEAKKSGGVMSLKRPPTVGESAWFEEDFTVKRKVRDRELFS
jgi:hypothetical protein